VEVTGFEPVAPALRMLRPHPSDRAICALTWGFVLNTSHRFAWFRSVSRAERAQSCGWAGSTRPVHVPAVLHAVDQNNLLVFEDLVDDSVVATSRRPQALEFTDQRFAEPVRVLSDRTEDRLQGSVAHLLRESVEMAETLSRDLDLVHPATSDVILETNPLALLSVPARTPKRLHKLIVLENIEGFLERLEVVRTQQDERRSSVPGDQNTVVLALHPVGEFGKVGLDFRERNCVAHIWDIIGQNIDPYNSQYNTTHSPTSTRNSSRPALDPRATHQ